MAGEGCIFCRIARGEAPAQIIWEDEQTMAFLDIAPVARGHTLVIPRRHYRDLMSVPDEELAAVMATAKRVARALMEGLGATGVNVLHASGVAAGQSVFHFHLHLIPRREGDGLDPWPEEGYQGREREREQEDDPEEVCKRIRAALALQGPKRYLN